MIRAFFVCFLLALPAHAETITGRVVKVTDGDTLTIQSGLAKLDIRLHGIDSPEMRGNQDYAAEARTTLVLMTMGQIATVDVLEKKGRPVWSYNRLVGDVTVNGLDIEQEMIGRGAAWLDRRYSRDPMLEALEAQAMSAKRGLWADADAIPPWTFKATSKAAGRLNQLP